MLVVPRAVPERERCELSIGQPRTASHSADFLLLRKMKGKTGSKGVYDNRAID